MHPHASAHLWRLARRDGMPRPKPPQLACWVTKVTRPQPKKDLSLNTDCAILHVPLQHMKPHFRAAGDGEDDSESALRLVLGRVCGLDLLKAAESEACVRLRALARVLLPCLPSSSRALKT